MFYFNEMYHAEHSDIMFKMIKKMEWNNCYWNIRELLKKISDSSTSGQLTDLDEQTSFCWIEKGEQNDVVQV